MKKLGRKNDIQENTMQGFKIPCSGCGSCSCGCSGNKNYQTDFNSDDVHAYDPVEEYR
ncbi:CLI_3235 family bacteriocin precursor [Clostridiaceae bacterium M8S5]|nr:CLI_3235 family bacteriocin precursor [Clostridiaceae bacterium M8S5]